MNMSYTSYSDQKWLLQKKNRMGFTESLIFTGNLRNKPKGWKVVGKA